MSWNMAPECISTVMLCIIWIYSRKGNPTPSLKNKYFQISFLTTFCSMIANIISALLIAFLTPHTLVLTWIITTIYFIATPLMGMVFFYYSLANFYEGDPRIKRYITLASIPGVLYAVGVLINPITRNVFNITNETGYTQEKYIMVTYLVFYLYCLASILLVLLQGKRVPTASRIILFFFPLVAVVVIIIQVFSAGIILTGSAATCAILLIYLYLQNKQLSIDHLTGIPNRQELLKWLELSLKKDKRFAILILSLRDFKQINDTYGQHNGDDLLKVVSTFLRKELGMRTGELYRYSGDEFALVLEDITEDQLEHLIEFISARMAQPWNAPDCTCFLSAAIGIVWYPDLSDSLEGLIKGIEYSVSIAKTDYVRNNICYCTTELLEKAKRHQAISELLAHHLETEDFDIFYQPIYTVSSQSFVMAEALLRINNSPLGAITPGEFIPIAEENGLIIDITYLVLKKVCHFIRSLLDQNIELDGVNVNFSAIQFTQKDLIERMKEIITESGIPFSKIKVEITESTLAENAEVIIDFMNRMHDLGIRIGLDDFGTGYSNLTSVITLPIDTIKLDKSLVWAAMKNERFSITLQNITRAFCALDMTVLAEGVETKEQSDYVVDCGCSLIQGFLYARPMPEEAFDQFMKAQYLPIKKESQK